MKEWREVFGTEAEQPEEFDTTASPTTVWEMQTEFSTPDLKDGFQIDVYVDPNLIEVFVNDGEYIISNCVYNLGTDIHQQGNVKYEMYTLEGTDVSEV